MHRSVTARLIAMLASCCLVAAVAGAAEAPPRKGGRKASRAGGGEAKTEDPKAPSDLAAAVAAILDRAGKGWQSGVVIVDDTGKVRASVRADVPLSPASNQKILTVGSALGLVGPDFAYETTLAAPGAPAGGAISALIVKGTGDPNIPNRFENQDPTVIFRAWATEMKKKGVTKVGGDIVIDDSYFDDIRFMPGWKENQQANWYEAEIGAVNLNDNCIEIEARPAKPGQPAEVIMKPVTSYVKIENTSRTVAGKPEGKKVRGRAAEEPIPIFNRKNGTNTIVVSGEIWSGRKLPVNSPPITIEDPGLYFGTVLGEVLRAEGIAVDGKVVRGKLAERAGPSPFVLVQHRSLLSTDLRIINKHSQNLHAEILLKAIGAKKGGEGSLAGGTRAVEAFLKTAGIAAPGLTLQDGSGLAAGNRVSPSTLSGVLAWIARQPFFRAYRDSLPIANVDGTLKKRFKGSPCAGHVYAKTGYIKGVSALSGYVERGGRNWVFSILINGLRGDLTAAQKAEQDIAEMIYASMPAK